MTAFTPGLESRLAAIADRCTGELGLAVRDIDDDARRVTLGGNKYLPTASVIKVPILVEALRQAEGGRVSLDDRLELKADERIGGSGILKVLQPGLQPTLLDAATLMVVLSDNTATNLVLDAIGGVDPVNAAMDELGFDRIRLHNRIDFDLIGPDVRRLGEATSEQMCDLLLGIARREVFGPDVSARAEAIMEGQQYLDQVPRYFDMNPYWRELKQEPTISVACKTGFFTGTRVDAGIVRFPEGKGGFAYYVANHGLSDETFLPEAEGALVNGEVGRVILEAWWPDALGPVPVVAATRAP